MAALRLASGSEARHGTDNRKKTGVMKKLYVVLLVIGFLLVVSEPETLQGFVFNFIGIAMCLFALGRLGALAK